MEATKVSMVAGLGAECCSNDVRACYLGWFCWGGFDGLMVALIFVCSRFFPGCVFKVRV